MGSSRVRSLGNWARDLKPARFDVSLEVSCEHQGRRDDSAESAPVTNPFQGINFWNLCYSRNIQFLPELYVKFLRLIRTNRREL
jgi:hypothetical protein